MDPVPPAARRFQPPRWRDGRFVAGVVLVLASVLGGGAVIGAADRSVEVWALRRTLPAGTTIERGDLVARRVRLDAVADRYLDARRPVPPGALLLRDVGAGELLPGSAVGPPGRGPARRVVSIPVSRAHALGGEVERGMRVDVVATYTAPGGRVTTVPVVRNATVVGVTRPPSGFAAGKAELGLLLEVDPEVALAVAAAVEAAAIDVLRVVPGSDGDGDIGATAYVAGPPPR